MSDTKRVNLNDAVDVVLTSEHYDDGALDRKRIERIVELKDINGRLREAIKELIQIIRELDPEMELNHGTVNRIRNMIGYWRTTEQPPVQPGFVRQFDADYDMLLERSEELCTSYKQTTGFRAAFEPALREVVGLHYGGVLEGTLEELITDVLKYRVWKLNQ